MSTFHDAIRIIEENMGHEFSQQFGIELSKYIEEKSDIAIENECAECPYYGNEYINIFSKYH